MLSMLAQSSLPGAAHGFAKELPKPESPTQTILWAVLGVVLLLVIFGFVIKMKMDGER